MFTTTRNSSGTNLLTKGSLFQNQTVLERRWSFALPLGTEVWLTVVESGWNLCGWLVGVVNRMWVWLVSRIYVCCYQEIVVVRMYRCG